MDRSRALSIAFLLLATSSCALNRSRPATPSTEASSQETASTAPASKGHHWLTILHTNDIHASFGPAPATWTADKAPIGGFEMLDAVVTKIRAEQPDTLLLDAGDVMTGNPISRISDDGIPGWGLFTLMEEAGYDAWTLGNHDFDQGQENLHELLSKLDFPTLESNLSCNPASPIHDDILSHVIVNVGVLRVGLMGVLTPELPELVADSSIEGVNVLPPEKALEEEVRALDPKTDVLIVLSHMGDERDRQLAGAVSGIDVIVGGHSHKRLYPPEQIGKTLIVQAGSHLQNLGRLDLEIAHDEVVDYKAELIPLWLKPEVKVSEGMRERVSHARSLVEAEFGEVLGTLEAPWTRSYYGESNVGDWLTDRMREYAEADVALLNSGGIRADLPAGPISKGDLMTVLPFDNQLCLFQVKGKDLERMVQANADATVAQSHGILQVSGLRYRYTRKEGTARIVELTVNGVPIDPERIYRVSTNEYILFHQRDKYLPGIDPIEPKGLGTPILSILVDAVREAQRIDARVEGRIAEIPEGSGVGSEEG